MELEGWKDGLVSTDIGEPEILNNEFHNPNSKFTNLYLISNLLHFNTFLNFEDIIIIYYIFACEMPF